MSLKSFLFIMLLGLGLGLFMQYQFRAPKRGFSDYRVYYNAGKDILTGKNIYVRASEEITPFKYSPSFAVFMAPFAIFDKRVSANLFFLFNLVCLYYCFWFSRKLIFFVDLSFKKTALIIFLVLILSFRAILHCLDSGQVGILILFLILLGLFSINKGKAVRGSFLIGYAGMIKYMPFIFGFYFLLKKSYKITLLIVFAFICFCLFPAIFIGLKTNFIYLKEWLPYITSTSLDQGSFLSIKNYSLWSVSKKLFPYYGEIFTSALTIVLFFIAVFLFSFKKREKNTEISKLNDCVDYGMIFLSMALFNPNAWLHNFLVVIFPYMIVIYYLFRCNFKDKLVLLFVFFSFILFSLGSESLVGDKIQVISDSYSLVTWGVLFIFAALVKIKFFSKVRLLEI